MGQKNKDHNTYIRKGVRGIEEALLILGGAGVVSRGPSSRQAAWVSGWVCGTQREKAFTEMQQQDVNREREQLTDTTCASWKAVPLLLLIKLE